MTDTTDKTIENYLTEARDLARNEYNHLQVVGHALTGEELQRSESLRTCLEHIGKALEALKNEY